MPACRTWTLRSVGPYDLATAVRGHGWYDLAPHAWDAERATLSTAIALGPEVAVDVSVTPASADAVRVRVVATQAPDRATAARVRSGIRRALRLDVDLTAFWSMCDEHDRLAWVPARRGGHLMQSATWFEDLLKILFTTNCTWAATRSMCRNLVEAIGPVAPSGRRAFPTAARCAAESPSFWRDVVRAGYRDRACAELARRCADGSLDEAEFTDTAVPVDVLRKRLLALPGFGPYAVGHVLRGLGHYEDLAIDSWCRAKMAEILGRRKAPSDAWFTREYRRFGRFAGLALWMELTADWHRPRPDVP